MIKLLMPVRINWRTEELPNLLWNGESALSYVLLFAQVFGHSTDKMQSSQGIWGICSSLSLLVQPVPSRQDCHAAQPNAALSASPHLPTGCERLKSHGNVWIRAFSASIWPLVTLWSWIPEKNRCQHPSAAYSSALL